MADGIYSPLSSGNKFDHAKVNRPFPSGGIAVASGEANYADFDQHNTAPSSVYNPSGVLWTPPLDTFGSDIRGQSGLEPIAHFSNSSKHATPTQILATQRLAAASYNFPVVFNVYIHYTPNPSPTRDLYGNMDFSVKIPKFIPKAIGTSWNGYADRKPEEPKPKSDEKEDES
jgi:hypothetical protein